MTRIALIVKYFPAPDRLSGLVTQTRLLVERLSSHVDLHILTANSALPRTDSYAIDSFHLHSLSDKTYWLQVPRLIRKIRPQTLIVLSGIHKSSWIYPAFSRLLTTPPSVRRLFVQAVNLDYPPGFWGRHVLRQFDTLLCSSQKTLSQYRESGLKEKATYFPPAVDIRAIRDTTPEPKSLRFRIGFYNHFNSVKGCDLAAEAFSRIDCDDTEFVLAGQGPMQSDLEEIARTNKNIRVTGYLSDPIPGIRACDVMVLPFRTSVSILGISQTVIECLAAGIPVIGTPYEAITEAIKHQHNGLIVNSMEDIINAISLLHDDQELRSRLSRNAAADARAYDIDRRVEQLLALI